MADDIGSVRGISGTSVALNNQSGQGAVKPSAKGEGNPNGCKPSRPEGADGPVAMPK